MLNLTVTAESETIADLVVMIRNMADEIEKTCNRHKDYRETELANGIWSTSPEGEIEFDLDDGKRKTLAEIYNPQFHD